MAVYYMEDALKNKTFTEETFKQEEFTIKKTWQLQPPYSDCITLRILVFDASKKKLYELETTVNAENK